MFWRVLGALVFAPLFWLCVWQAGKLCRQAFTEERNMEVYSGGRFGAFVWSLMFGCWASMFVILLAEGLKQ